MKDIDMDSRIELDCYKLPVPMCWKCPRGLWAKAMSMEAQERRLNPQVFKGCADDDRIEWSNRHTYCPLIPQFIEKQKKVEVSA